MATQRVEIKIIRGGMPGVRRRHDFAAIGENDRRADIGRVPAMARRVSVGRGDMREEVCGRYNEAQNR